MKKFFSLLAAVLFAGSMMATTYSMTPDNETTGNSSTSYITTLTEFTYMGVSWKMNQWNPSSLQVKTNQGSAASEFRFYNTSAFSGKITKVVVTFSALTLKSTSETGFMFVGGSEEVSATTGGVSGVWDEEAKTLTWEPAATDNFTYFALYQNGKVATGTNKLATEDAIVVTYDGGADPAVYYLIGSMNEWQGSNAYKFKANPGNNNEMMINVKLPANSEMKAIGVQGTDTTWYPDGTDNNFVINDAGHYTIYFRPDGQGGEGWHHGVLYAVNHPLINCAAAAALPKDEVAYLDEVLVTYVNGGNIYIKDESGYELIYANSFGLAAGDVVNGFVGKSSPYHNLPELVPTVALADLEIVHGEAPAPEEITAAPTAADVNKYLVIKGVALEGEFTAQAKGNLTATIGEETFTLYNNFKIAYTFVEGKTYDIVGAGSIYDENIQLYFISASEHTATAVENVDAEIKAIKRIENGQLVIYKNGVRYNATGTILK